MTRFVDLSHPVVHGMVTYPGLPAPEISDHLSREDSGDRYAEGTTFQIGAIRLVANTGTYVDAPFHRFADGIDLAGLPLERLADLPGIVLETAPTRNQGPCLLEGLDLKGKAVLFRTGWSSRFGTPAYAEGHPFLEAGTADSLVARGAALVGIDSLNIDDTAGGDRPVHTRLLEAGIPIVEHLTNLAALPGEGFRFTAVPAPIRGMGSFPVRAFARLEES